MRRISISVFACFVAVLFIPQNLAAQSTSVPAGEGFRQEGIASWYGPQFDGRPTASGEIFDSTQFTAAHPSLPFGTLLMVTNRNNNRQVSVRVNDRGPFVEGRIIDISMAAAEHLDMLVSGTAPVIVETVRSAGTQPTFPARVQAPVPPPQPVVQAQPVQVVQAQPVQVVQPPPPPAPPREPVFTPAPAPAPAAPVHVGTTTFPLEVPPNTPITINIFHAPQSQDSSSQPTVVVSPEPAAPVTVMPTVQVPIPSLVEPVVPAAPVTPSPATVAPAPQPAVVFPPSPVAAPPAAPQLENQEEWQLLAQAAPAQQAMPANQPGAVPVINADPNRTYRVQVGSFRVARNAVDTFVRLRANDFDPSYERNGEFFRVVLAGVRGSDVQSTVERLVRLGYHGVVVVGE